MLSVLTFTNPLLLLGGIAEIFLSADITRTGKVNPAGAKKGQVRSSHLTLTGAVPLLGSPLAPPGGDGANGRLSLDKGKVKGES